MDNYGIYIDYGNFYQEDEEMEEVCYGMTREEAEAEVEFINHFFGSKYPYVVLTENSTKMHEWME